MLDFEGDESRNLWAKANASTSKVTITDGRSNVSTVRFHRENPWRTAKNPVGPWKSVARILIAFRLRVQAGGCTISSSGRFRVNSSREIEKTLEAGSHFVIVPTKRWNLESNWGSRRDKTQTTPAFAFGGFTDAPLTRLRLRPKVRG